MSDECVDVVVIGAGPSGSLASALLAAAGFEVVILEREHFPRFSIGESLLPHSMCYLEQAGMLQAVVEAGFQYKNGARFVCASKRAEFDFRDKFTAGWGTTYQVERAHFDSVLAGCAQDRGVQIRFGTTVTEVVPDLLEPRVSAKDSDGTALRIRARHVLDASGFGRVLQRLLGLETPSGFPVRGAVFTHVADHIPAQGFDRDKITIAIHPQRRDLWYWLIPFAKGRCSLGVVGRTEELQRMQEDNLACLHAWVAEEPHLAELLTRANWDTPVRKIVNYSANVRSLVGPGFTLLGNAGEFLDPVFSSGVTIALKSASLAAALLERQLHGEHIDWCQAFEAPVRRGVDTFRCFVDMWYSGGLQNIFFHGAPNAEVKRMLCAILAGYAWDESNPYVAQTRRRLGILESLCAGDN